MGQALLPPGALAGWLAIAGASPSWTAENRPPVAAAGQDAAIECVSPAGAEVTLDGRGSSDPDSTPGTNDDIVRFEWSESVGGADPLPLGQGELLRELLPLGGHTIRLRVTDRAGASDTDEVLKTVFDAGAPSGGIVRPADLSCHGDSELPVVVGDDYTDTCDDSLSRSFLPRPSPETKVTAGDGRSDDRLGGAAAMGDDVALVGASQADGAAGTRTGAVYAWTRQGIRWREQKLSGSDSGSGDLFGHALALDGETAVIGAPWNDETGLRAGAAYVFERRPGGWVETQKLTASDGSAFDNFGASVDIDGDRIVVAANDLLLSPVSGSVYVFRRQHGRWLEETKLTSPSTRDEFGTRARIEGDTVAVSAITESSIVTHGGVLYVFRQEAGAWLPEVILRSATSQPFTEFGTALAFQDGLLAASSRESDGQVYLFRRGQIGWDRVGRLVPWDVRLIDGGFGNSLAIDGERVIVGAPADDRPLLNTGSVYVFGLEQGRWVPRERLTPSDPAISLRFGRAVGAFGGTLAVGADGDDTVARDAGAAYLFREPPPGSYRRHGDYPVTLRVLDDSGNEASDSVFFTIDLVPPTVELLDFPSTFLVPSSVPLATVFVSADEDGARGDVVRERLYLEDCLYLDGATAGDADGLLRDESLDLSTEALCEALARCGLDSLGTARLRIEVEDCAGNAGQDFRFIRLDPEHFSANCL